MDNMPKKYFFIIFAVFIGLNLAYGQEIVPIPEWKEGYFWTFDIKGPKGKTAEITWMVVGEDRLDNRACFKVKAEKKREGGTDEWIEYFEKQTGLYLGFIPIRAEKFRKANVDTQGFYRFPFKTGDKWSLRFDVNTWTNFKVDKAIIKMVTPAGEFDTLKITMKYEWVGGQEGRKMVFSFSEELRKNY